MPNPLRMRFGEPVPPSQSGFRIRYRGRVIDVGLPASYALQQAVAPSMAKIASCIASHPGNPDLAAAGFFPPEVRSKIESALSRLLGEVFSARFSNAWRDKGVRIGSTSRETGIASLSSQPSGTELDSSWVVSKLFRFHGVDVSLQVWGSVGAPSPAGSMVDLSGAGASFDAGNRNYRISIGRGPGGRGGIVVFGAGGSFR